jgi:hypothetical protein
MTLPIVGSRYGFATYGWRTADAGGVHFNLADFLLFLDAIGITSTHRFVKTSPDNQINIRFPAVDSDLIQLGNVNDSFNDGRYRAQIFFSNTIGQNPFFWGCLGHTYQTKTQLNDNRASILGNYGAESGYFYACGDSKGIAMFAINNTGLNTFGNNSSFHYFGYCDNPASVAYFGNNNSYPLDYIAAYRGLGNGLGFGRMKEMTLPGLSPPGTVAPQSVLPITSINCTTPTPGANISDLMFIDDGASDYGTNYPLGRARPFLLYSNQNLTVNSLVRVLNEDEPTPEDHFHIVVSSVTGGGSILMPIITENYTLP